MCGRTAVNRKTDPLTQGGRKGVGCFVRGDETVRVELINRYVLTKSQTSALSGAYFRAWYGFLSDLEDTKVPLNRSKSGIPLPAAHTRKNPVGRIFRDMGASQVIKEAQAFHQGRIQNLDGGLSEPRRVAQDCGS